MDHNAAAAANMRPPDEVQQPLHGFPGPGYVTLGRGEFDLLCRKLNGLENSIADLRREMRRNTHDQNGMHDSDGGTSSDGQHPQTHTEAHGLHTKNESVSDFV